MKKSTLRNALVGLTLMSSSALIAQNPGLLISEFLQNPSGNDSPFEYVELLATDNIDFSVTPYTVIVSNNGNATADGWIAGGGLTYAFEITSGTVALGDVVYVGGSTMAPTGTKLRIIDTGAMPGDGGIGNANATGVFGNGGSNGDGIAIFNMGVGSITSSTVPVDAIIYGTGVGTAEVNAGVDGYELPINDLYSGGKLNASSYVAVDEDLTVAFGQYDPVANVWVTPRTFAADNATDTSAIILGAPAPNFDISFSTDEQTVSEAQGVLTINLDINSSSTQSGSFEVNLSGVSNVTNLSDFVLMDTVITLSSSATGTVSFDVTIIDDAVEEQTEYLVFNLINLTNVSLSGDEETIIYIKDNDRVIAEETNEVKLDLLTSYSNGAEGSNSAEIVAFDEATERLFIANSIANNLDIVDFSNPSSPVAVTSINLDTIGGINSVAVNNGIVALAIENANPQMDGFIVFFDAAGVWLNKVVAGAMPDMLTFNNAGNKVIVACEGEPADDYLTDPEGTIAVIDLSNGVSNLVQGDVTLLDFNSFDAQITTLQGNGVRIFGPGATVSQDLEPEYVTVLDDDSKAFVSLQENNAFAVVDLQTLSITDILPLGTIDHNQFGFGLDASNQTSDINIANFPIKGMFMPDAITHVMINGSNYILTANEGDSRDYSAYSEEERVKDLVLDATAFPNADELQSSLLLGRLKTTSANGDADNNNEYEEIYTFGTRSFSIWDENGNLVFDSGDWFEQIIANDPTFNGLFNAGNDPGSADTKDRSDDKGPEPEGVAVAQFDGNYIAFVSLERVGGVMMFNINDPMNPEYVGYYNNRDVSTNGPDRGAEGLLIIDETVSPTGNTLVILANEVSSTLTVYEAMTCADLSAVVINGSNSYCAGDSVNLTASGNGTLTYQWMMDGAEISGETMNNLWASNAGDYGVMYENVNEECMGYSDEITISENALPTPTITVSNGELMTQSFASYEWYYEGTAITSSNTMTYQPQQDGDYTVLVTDANGCSDSSAVFNVAFTGVELASMIELSMMPNPANDMVTFSSNSLDVVTVEVFNLNGELIRSAQFSEKMNMNLSDVPSGVYMVVVDLLDATVNTKLVIQH